MTQAQAIAKGYTHFIEVWRDVNDKEGITSNTGVHKISFLGDSLFSTRALDNLYTVCIFLCKLKPKQ